MHTLHQCSEELQDTVFMNAVRQGHSNGQGVGTPEKRLCKLVWFNIGGSRRTQKPPETSEGAAWITEPDTHRGKNKRQRL